MENNTEPIEIDFDAMADGCLDNIKETAYLIIIFVLTIICH
jgi:hypothetical protein